MKYTIIFGGKAGQGPNILAEIVSQGLLTEDYYVFYSRDYESLIRGGHNFNTLTFSTNEVYSNSSKANILVCLDENTSKLHKDNLIKDSITLEFKQGKGNMFFAGAIFKILGLKFEELEKQLKKLRNFDQNIKEATEGFKQETRRLNILKPNHQGKKNFMNGNQAIAKASIKSGLEFYYAYPMTPATPLMMELGQETLNKENKHKVIELESEIAVINAALGSSLTGSKSMIGTSGGGFDLMTESLSLAGMAKIPLVIYLSQRPGPSTGVATYSSQGDLNVARFAGHGEFSRVILAPGDIIESEELTNLAFYFSQKFRIPVILLCDKHLAESKTTAISEAKIIKSKKSITTLERFNSYESDRDNFNVATEDAQIISQNFQRRMKEQRQIERESTKFESFKILGDKKSNNLILSWGSTKGAILDSLKELEKSKKTAKFIQVLFLDPFSQEIKKEIEKSDKVLVIENNATCQLGQLIAEKTGFIVEDKNKILRYDGRPFFSDELSQEILRRIR